MDPVQPNNDTLPPWKSFARISPPEKNFQLQKKNPPYNTSYNDRNDVKYNYINYDYKNNNYYNDYKNNNYNDDYKNNNYNYRL